MSALEIMNIIKAIFQAGLSLFDALSGILG